MCQLPPLSHVSTTYAFSRYLNDALLHIARVAMTVHSSRFPLTPVICAHTVPSSSKGSRQFRSASAAFINSLVPPLPNEKKKRPSRSIFQSMPRWWLQPNQHTQTHTSPGQSARRRANKCCKSDGNDRSRPARAMHGTSKNEPQKSENEFNNLRSAPLVPAPLDAGAQHRPNNKQAHATQTR